MDRVDVTLPGVRGGKPIVEGVTLRIGRGTTLGLVGESGSGKSLTALSIIGLLPASGYVSAGRVIFDGQDLTRLPDRRLQELRGARIGLVSQEPMVALDPCFTVRSQLTEALRAHQSVSRRAARAKASDLLRRLGIANPDRVAASYPHQLSGGMAQRVAIAMALAGEPELLIADEPTTALDVTVQAEILDLLRSLQEEFHMAMLIVSHDLGVVADICDEVAVMYAGQIVETGHVEDVLLRPAHPYTRALLDATPELYPHGADVRTVRGTVPAPQSWPVSCRFADRCPLAIGECRSRPIPLISTLGRLSRCIRAADVLRGTSKEVAP